MAELDGPATQELATDVGPVIDAEPTPACARHVERLRREARIGETPVSSTVAG